MGQVKTRRSSTRRLTAVLQALLVTFLWSTSWVMIKLGLQASLPALTFAGLRYTLAFTCLLPFALRNPAHCATLRHIPRRLWLQLVVLGVVYYALTQGSQFAALALAPAATLTLLLNFSPVLVALASSLFTREAPALAQWGGILLSLTGALVYLFPLNFPSGQTRGLAIGVIGVLSNAAGSVLGRQVNARGELAPLLVTLVSMGCGGILLLVVGAATQGFGALDLKQWLMIAWLAVINTAFAFTLWNHTLQTLSAVESSIINNSMMPQIAILAWLFLAEPLSLQQIGGILIVVMGTLFVQIRRPAGALIVASGQVGSASAPGRKKS